MRYRKLGKSGLETSVIGLGSWQWGGAWGQSFSVEAVRNLLARAAELGITLIDSAECYGDHLAETLIGQALAGQRERWLLATKFGHVHGAAEADKAAHWQPASVLRQLEASLRALGTDRIDIYQFHSGSDADLDNEALWSMLQRQRQAGKIRSLGISIGQPTNAYQAERATALGVDVIQVTYNALKRGAETAVLPACQRQRLGVINRTPLASGFLSGKYLPGARWPDNDVRSQRPAPGVDAELERARSLLAGVAAEVPKAAWALAWCLKHPAISCVIPGTKSLAQLETNVQALQWLPPEARILAGSDRVDKPPQPVPVD